jgi:putative membrane protein
MCSILPLDVICNRIQADVMATLKDDEDTKTILAEAGLVSLLPAATSTAASNGNGAARSTAAPAPNNGLQVRVALGADRK